MSQRFEEPMKPEEPKEEKVLTIEVTDYDKIILLRNGIDEYTYTTHPEDILAPRMSQNFYYLEDAGYIDWWKD